MGWLGYQTASQHLTQGIDRTLRISAELKGRHLQSLVDELTHGQTPLDLRDAGVARKIDQILAPPSSLGTGSRSYLIDSNLKWLAGMPPTENEAKVETTPARLWQKRLTGIPPGPVSPMPLRYTGPDGKPMMGTFIEIHLGTIPHALIVEMETEAALESIAWLRAIIVSMMILVGVAALVVATILAKAIVGPIYDLAHHARMTAVGRFDHGMAVTVDNEIGELAGAIGDLADHLHAVETQNDTQNRLMSGLAGLHRLIDGEGELDVLCLNTLEYLSDILSLCQADVHLINGDGENMYSSRFPGHPDEDIQQVCLPVGGWVGKKDLDPAIAFFHKKANSEVVTAVPTVDRANLMIAPLMLRNTINGLLILEKSEFFNAFDYQFVEAVAEVVALVVNAALIRRQEADLHRRTREQANQLKGREAALKASNRELQSQRQAFQASEKKLQLKQLELEAANAQMVKNAADLEAHMAILKTQTQDMQEQNIALEEAHRDLEEKARQLEMTSRYKTEFMANMSHELRTPLNSILLLSRLLLENKENTLTAKQAEFAKTIHSAGNELLHLIDEILDLAKVESGKMALDLEPLQVESIAEAMRVIFAPLADQSGLAFTIHVASDVPQRLISDRKRLGQIIKNFLANAFKFTTNGSIELEIAMNHAAIHCQKVGENADHGCLAISVTDTGIGIPVDKHQLVFEAFQQVDGSTRRKYGGTGLGLSISRELAHMLGGTIGLESQVGQGSRFTLYLPTARRQDETPLMKPIRRPTPSAAHMNRAPLSTNDDPPSDELDPPPAAMVPIDPSPAILAHTNYRPNTMDSGWCALKGRNVVLVDDDMRTVFAISNVLEDLGATVHAGKTGKETLDKLDDFPDIDLIIVDVMVSDINGHRFIREIRKRKRYQTLPIIVLTAKAMPGDRTQCILAGANDYLAKPVNPDNLKVTLSNWLEPQRTDSESVDAEKPIEPTHAYR